ncbi:MAG: hypothetical protein HY912_02905 [Desulfomonile tiedjei]|uniref:Kelch motif protein n=1 Tax=Desulfomonile tiedjei TaxID=2358 RepID=A0A9D6UXV7_9BACT|nr:hypothetical protein [Desulfomonile tiedjei]
MTISKVLRGLGFRIMLAGSIPHMLPICRKGTKVAQEPYKVINLFDWTGGVHDRRQNPLAFPVNALTAGENVDLADGGLKTRRGMSVTHPNTSVPNGEFRFLKQVRFPTTETTYLIGQASERHPTYWETRSGGSEREGHSAVWDSENGRVLLFGGRSTMQEYCNDVLAYDPDTDVWSTVTTSGMPPSARYGHTAVLDAERGFMYIFGGRSAAGALNDCHRLDISTNTWSEVITSGAIPSLRYHHAAVLIPGSSAKMLVNGGRPISSYVRSVTTYYLLDLSTFVWTEVAGTVADDLFMHGRCGHSMVFDGAGTVYLFGGDYIEFYWQNCWKLDLDTATWQSLADLPATLTSGLGYHRAIYCSGYVVCLGGRGAVIYDWNTAYQIYDCAENTWVTVLPGGDPGTRFRHVAVATEDSRIIVHGGIWQLDPVEEIRSNAWCAKKLCSEAAGIGFWGGYGLYASADHLPTTDMSFEAVYPLTEKAGVVSIETLGDRAVITEGVEEVPLVFLPGTLSGDPVSGWASPLRVLLTYDGENFHEISDEVLDDDLDSVADIGGVTTRGWIAICCDVPMVNGFYFEFQTPNNAAGVTTQFSEVLRLNDITKLDREDLKSTIDRYVQDAAETGHFEGTARTLAGAAVDLGGSPNKVKVPCAGHGFVAGNTIEIRNTTSYNGTYVLPAQTEGDADNFVIEHAFAGENFAAPDEVRQRFTLGVGQDIPLVESGVVVVFGTTEISIKDIIGNGEDAGGVTLSTEHASSDVDAVHGIVVDDDSDSILTLGKSADAADTLFNKPLIGTSRIVGAQLTFILPASDFSADAEYIRVTLAAGTADIPVIHGYNITNNNGLVVESCQIGERDGETWNVVGSATPITFNNGQAEVTIGKGGTAISDLIEFTIDKTKDCLVTIVGSGYLLADLKPIGDEHLCKTGTMVYRLEGGVKTMTGLQALAAPTTLHTAITNDESQISLLGVDSVKSVRADITRPGESEIYFAVSLDQRQSWQVFVEDAWRTVAKLNGSDWEYNNGAVGTDNFVSSGSIEPWTALRSAFALEANQWVSEDIIAMSEANWSALTGYPALDFAVCLRPDGDKLPTVTSLTVNVYDSGGSECAGWMEGDWHQGAGWTDNTSLGGVPFARNGTITCNSGVFTADYAAIAGIPGYWYRVLMRGTSIGTTLSKVRYRAPVQPLRNIGDGQPDTALGFIFHDTSAGKVLDYTVEMSDSTYTAASSASCPVKTDDFIYAGYLTAFNEMEIIPYSDNNQNVSELTVKYWNGLSWQPISIVDGTSDGSKTLRKRGKIKWTLPENWKQNIPLEGLALGYWLQLSVSANLSATCMLSECRVYPVPLKLVKHKGAAVFQNRLALFDRPDAHGQVDVSREAMECCFTGDDSYSYNLGNQISCGISAWNTLLLGSAESWNQLESLSAQGIEFQAVEAARHMPVNSRVIVKAPLRISEDGDRYGLFFLNQYGAFCQAGLATDSTYGTSRAVTISDTVNWWNSDTTPRMDKDYLHLACGEYWPARNWVVWAVPMILSGNGPQTANNRLIVFDLSFRTWLPPFTMSLASLTTAYHYSPGAPGKTGSVGLYAGDYQGRVLRLFGPDDDTDLGAAINAWAETGWLHFGSPEYRKILRLLSIYGKSSSGPISVQIYCDGEQTPRLALNFDDLAGLGTRPFALEQESNNIQGRFYKFRISFNGPAETYGMQLGFALIREWGA